MYFEYFFLHWQAYRCKYSWLFHIISDSGQIGNLYSKLGFLQIILHNGINGIYLGCSNGCCGKFKCRFRGLLLFIVTEMGVKIRMVTLVFLMEEAGNLGEDLKVSLEYFLN